MYRRVREEYEEATSYRVTATMGGTKVKNMRVASDEKFMKGEV